MFEQPHLWRAVYDENRKSYVVEKAGRADGVPVIEYRFDLLEDPDDERLIGTLDKYWVDEDGDDTFESYAFGFYANEAAFEADLEAVRHEAREHAQEENLDSFLAIIDRIKDRAVDAGFDDEDVFDFDGLFEEGPEDAYLLQEMDPQTRLHDHVERSEECWRIYPRPVNDPEGQSLGWGVFALLYSGLTSAATDEQLENAERAYLIDLDHHKTEVDARFTAVSLLRFMHEGDRIHDPEFARMDDSVVLECTSLRWRVEGYQGPTWHTLDRESLQRFHGEPVVRDLSDWHPRHADALTEFAEAFDIPSHVEDQLRAKLDDEMGIRNTFGKDSPWHQLEVDEE